MRTANASINLFKVDTTNGTYKTYTITEFVCATIPNFQVKPYVLHRDIQREKLLKKAFVTPKQNEIVFKKQI